MVSWLRHNMRPSSSPIDLEGALITCLKDRTNLILQGKDLFYQFGGAAELKEAKALAAKEKYYEAAEALGGYFKYRISPRALLQHSDPEQLRPILARTNRYAQFFELTAQEILGHTFRIIQGQPYKFEKSIDWFSDFAGHSWPRLHISDIDERLKAGIPLNDRATGTLASTWKFNTHAHLLTLGRAYWLTGQESYVAEYIVEIVKWCQENPPLQGVNWYEKEYLAKRAVNWLLALGMFIESPQLQPAHLASIIECLLVHAELLAYWLRREEHPQLEMVVALYLLASWLPEAHHAKTWLEITDKSWSKALAGVLNEDNVHRSTSPMSHLLCTEWLLLVALQHDISRRDLSSELDTALNECLDTIQSLSTSAQDYAYLGGVFHHGGFMGQLCTPADHARNIMALGTVLTQRGDLYCNQPADPYELLWWLGESGWEDLRQLSNKNKPNKIFLYPHTGLAVGRDSWEPKSSHFTFRAAPTNLLTPSAEPGAPTQAEFLFHNDALSLTLSLEDEPFIIEPGLGLAPTQHDYRLSRLSAHSAPHLSNEIEYPYPPESVAELKRQNISLPSAALCSRLVGNRYGNRVTFGASRYAYTKNGTRITITRHIIFQPEEKLLILRDKLEGEVEVPYECNFLLAPHLFLMMRGDMGCRLLGKKLNARIIPHLPKKSYYTSIKGSTQPFLGWHYTAVGTLAPANYLRYANRSLSLPAKLYFTIHWDNRDAELPKPDAIDEMLDK